MGSCHPPPHSSHGPGVGGDQASVCGHETGLGFYVPGLLCVQSKPAIVLIPGCCRGCCLTYCMAPYEEPQEEFT